MKLLPNSFKLRNPNLYGLILNQLSSLEGYWTSIFLAKLWRLMLNTQTLDIAIKQTCDSMHFWISFTKITSLILNCTKVESYKPKNVILCQMIGFLSIMIISSLGIIVVGDSWFGSVKTCLDTTLINGLYQGVWQMLHTKFPDFSLTFFLVFPDSQTTVFPRNWSS